MTISERTTTVASITESETRVSEFDRLQDELNRLDRIKGNVRQVNFISDQDNMTITDADMLTKAEAAIVKLITSTLAEQVAI